MKRRWLATVVITALTLAAAGEVSAESYSYESTTTTTREGSKKPQRDVMLGWVDGAKVKLEFADAGQDGKVRKGMYLLTTDAGETLYMVDPENKSYYEFDLELMMGMAGGMLQIEFSDVSMEKLGEEAGGTVNDLNTMHVTWRTQFTMSMNIIGMKRQDRYDTTQDVWVTKAIGGDAWSMWLKMMPSSMKGDAFIDWASDSGLANSFPLKSRTVTAVTNKKGKTSRMTADMQVTKLSVEPIAPSVFVIPADYTKAEMLPPEWGGAGGEAGGPMKQLKGMFGKKKKKDGG